MAWNPVRPSAERLERRDAVLTDQGPEPMLRTVARLRSEDERALLELISEARHWFTARGITGFAWWLGPSSTPASASELIRADTGRTFEEITATALILDHEPATSKTGLEVREVNTFEDYAAMMHLIRETADRPEADREGLTRRLPQLWDEAQLETHARKSFLAFSGDQPVSAGTLAILASGDGLLAGAATDHSYRGRGCYAALVAYRWRIAKELSLRALVVQASTMSRPILEKVGFTATAELTAIIDRPTL
jgi:GNAT superfamily N-acetyltransferase